MNKSLLYVAGIFTAGCALMSTARNDNFFNPNKDTYNNIVQKDGTIVEYGHIRNRLPKNMMRIYKPSTYAFVQKNGIKI